MSGNNVPPTFGAPLTPFVQNFLPAAEKVVPPHHYTADLWVLGSNATGNNTMFRTQWIECSYPISANYERTPRYIFYALALFTVLMRKSAWIGTAALGSVMAYSATAAVHAIILVALRTKLVTADLLDYMVVLAEGNTIYGSDDGTANELWLPVLPMAWDNDGDPVLAIVGTAFLILLPMAAWSSTFNRSKAQAVIFLWSGLLLIGTICALINAAYVDLWAFPQLRFCPLDMNDSLPLTNSGSNIAGADWFMRDDPYYWNATVQEIFQNDSLFITGRPNTCLYPCFATQWPLREPTEIVALSGNTGAVGDSQIGWDLFFAVYAVVSASGFSGLTVLAIGVAGRLPKGISSRTREWLVWVTIHFGSLLNFSKRITKASRLDRVLTKKRMLAFWHCYVHVVQFYVRFISPLGLLFFVAWAEWYMWTNDPQGETFRHVGQWGSLVAALLVAFGALVSHYWAVVRGRSDSDPPLGDVELESNEYSRMKIVW